jgi:hypothetical protein
MGKLEDEARAFEDEKREWIQEARQLAAVSLLCGADLSAAFAAGPSERAALILRLERIIERERLKGARRHWSYDLNRHIALKQALDRLRDRDGASARNGYTREQAGKKNGARRRR